MIVWSIKQSGTDTFSATYEVDQQIKDGEQTSNVKATYTVKVHVDADGDMVIVQNPTLAPVSYTHLIAIGEYVSIEELNEMYEMIEELPDYIVELSLIHI